MDYHHHARLTLHAPVRPACLQYGITHKRTRIYMLPTNNMISRPSLRKSYHGGDDVLATSFRLHSLELGKFTFASWYPVAFSGPIRLA
jgi:hypothetical protein